MEKAWQNMATHHIPEDRVPGHLLAIGKGIKKELQERYKNILCINGLVCHDLTTDTGFCYNITVYNNYGTEEVLVLSVNTNCVEVSTHIYDKIKRTQSTNQISSLQFEYADPDLINNLYLAIHEYFWPRHLKK